MTFDPIEIVMRWLHVMSAIAAAGGTIFALVALLPALKELPDDLKKQVHERVRPRFAKLVMISIAALLISGFYNYIFVKVPVHAGQGLYHGLMGVKILFAMAVFFIASALVGRAPAFEGLRQKRAKWMTLNVVMAAVIVAIGAVLSKIPFTH